jgi:hypothetical protein
LRIKAMWRERRDVGEKWGIRCMSGVVGFAKGRMICFLSIVTSMNL